MNGKGLNDYSWEENIERKIMSSNTLLSWDFSIFILPEFATKETWYCMTKQTNKQIKSEVKENYAYYIIIKLTGKTKI